MHLELLNWQEFIVFYVNQNTKITINRNDKNKDDNYIFICKKNQVLNINDNNIKFIITEFDYQNFIECHNLKLQNQTFKIINDADITFKSKIIKDINCTRTEIYKLINLQNVYYKKQSIL